MLISSLAMADISSWGTGYGQASPESTRAKSAFRFTAGLGSTNISDMMEKDGYTVFPRIAIAADMLRSEYLNLGLEVGVQTGNHMRIMMTTAQQAALGGTNVSVTVNGPVDILLSADIPFSVSIEGALLSGFVKAGGAYRTMHTDRNTVNSLQKINPELQLGLSLEMGSHSSVSFGYQGIFAGKIGFTTNSTTNTGNIKNIPTQHGALVTFNYHA